MPEREHRATTESQERLRPGEVLLFPKPGYFMQHVRYAGALAIYRRYINPLDPNPSEVNLAVHEPQIQEHIRQYGFQEFHEYERKVITEYSDLLNGLIDAVGEDNLHLTNNSFSPSENTHTYTLEGRSTAYDNQVVHMQSITFPAGFHAFPRDMFTQFGRTIFVNPWAFPRFRETNQYRKSRVGEGGMSVIAKNAIIFSEKLQEDKTAIRDIKALEQRGYKVAFVPPVIREKQPPDRQEFAENHIDGHCALIMGKDKKLHLLFALSYAEQDRKTLRALVGAGRKVDAEMAAVQDSEMAHLDLNFIQLPDGSVVYPVTGRETTEGYLASGLDRALIDLVGGENIIYVPSVVNMTRLTRAGLRCMTNTAPVNFLTYLARNAV